MLSGFSPKLACQSSVLNFDPFTCEINDEFSLKLAPVAQDEDELQYILLQNVDADAVRFARSWTQQQRKQAARKIRAQILPSTTSAENNTSDQRIEHGWFDDEMDMNDFEYLDPEDWEDFDEDDAHYQDNNGIQTFDDDGVSSADDELPSPPAVAAEENLMRNEVVDDKSQTDSDNDEVAVKAVVASTFAPSAPGSMAPQRAINPSDPLEFTPSSSQNAGGVFSPSISTTNQPSISSNNARNNDWKDFVPSVSGTENSKALADDSFFPTTGSVAVIASLQQSKQPNKSSRPSTATGRGAGGGDEWSTHWKTPSASVSGAATDDWDFSSFAAATGNDVDTGSWLHDIGEKEGGHAQGDDDIFSGAANSVAGLTPPPPTSLSSLPGGQSAMTPSAAGPPIPSGLAEQQEDAALPAVGATSAAGASRSGAPAVDTSAFPDDPFFSATSGVPGATNTTSNGDGDGDVSWSSIAPWSDQPTAFAASAPPVTVSTDSGGEWEWDSFAKPLPPRQPSPPFSTSSFPAVGGVVIDAVAVGLTGAIVGVTGAIVGVTGPGGAGGGGSLFRDPMGEGSLGFATSSTDPWDSNNYDSSTNHRGHVATADGSVASTIVVVSDNAKSPPSSSTIDDPILWSRSREEVDVADTDVIISNNDKNDEPLFDLAISEVASSLCTRADGLVSGAALRWEVLVQGTVGLRVSPSSLCTQVEVKPSVVQAATLSVSDPSGTISPASLHTNKLISSLPPVRVACTGISGTPSSSSSSSSSSSAPSSSSHISWPMNSLPRGKHEYVRVLKYRHSVSMPLFVRARSKVKVLGAGLGAGFGLGSLLEHASPSMVKAKVFVQVVVHPSLLYGSATARSTTGEGGIASAKPEHDLVSARVGQLLVSVSLEGLMAGLGLVGGEGVGKPPSVTVDCGAEAGGQSAPPGQGLGQGQGKGRANPVPGSYDARTQVVVWDCSTILPTVACGGNGSGGGRYMGGSGGVVQRESSSSMSQQPWLFDFEVLIAGLSINPPPPSLTASSSMLPPPTDGVPITVQGLLANRLVSGLEISAAQHSDTQQINRRIPNPVTRSEQAQFECKFA